MPFERLTTRIEGPMLIAPKVVGDGAASSATPCSDATWRGIRYDEPEIGIERSCTSAPSGAAAGPDRRPCEAAR